ncbi:hypothetical protein DdX_15163 [Ditylenchus destructor]|uniref:Uncharacterized protein n=1 Tax=Ditylenchus destructor TaxID=166010 RepID=A0AAD4R139_9BILA|nr:hypothetical protein DdX_15163 [Ditylenchus destructor]
MINTSGILLISFTLLLPVLATENKLFSEFVQLINVMSENGTIEAGQIFLEMTADWEAYKAFRCHLDAPAKKVLMLRESSLTEPNLTEPPNSTLPKVEEALEDMKHKEVVEKAM